MTLQWNLNVSGLLIDIVHTYSAMIYLNSQKMDLWLLLKYCTVMIIWRKTVGVEGSGGEGEIYQHVELYHEK